MIATEFRFLWFVVFYCVGVLVVACSNPINQVTSDGYAKQCDEAERNGRLDIAEQACCRALVNVDVGNLGDEQKSQKLYNLARIKRKIGKFAEAELLCRESLTIEDKLSSGSKDRIGREIQLIIAA